MNFSLPLFLEQVRDSLVLTREDIRAFTFGLDGFPPEQVSAFLAHAYHRPLSRESTVELMLAMRDSGKKLDWRGLDKPVVDKHSTGGVGDKVTICMAPLLTAMGMNVPTISGRGLGFSGGTVDKLEAIPGMRVELSPEEIGKQVRELGMAFAAQTPAIAPADRKLYALRDVTATVESIPLITASILCKKLAEGLNHLTLDVKYGSGAFMNTIEKARELARWLTAVAAVSGTPTKAYITTMNQPLGYVSGNACEVAEAIAILKNDANARVKAVDTRELTLVFAADLAVRSGLAVDEKAARALAETTLASGKAFEVFCRVVTAQGGNPDGLRHDASWLPKTRQTCVIAASKTGYVRAIDVKSLGRALVLAGAGRQKRDDRIDSEVSLVHPVKIGDAVRAGDTLCELHHNGAANDGVLAMLTQAYDLAESPVPREELILEEIAS